MRLIDADELNEKILDVEFTGLGWYKANKAVNDMPTAYDVEAVVEQIEEWNKVTGALPEHSTWYYELISIIERGGVKLSDIQTQKKTLP